jgi:hypothetical protein
MYVNTVSPDWRGSTAYLKRGSSLKIVQKIDKVNQSIARKYICFIGELQLLTHKETNPSPEEKTNYRK